MIRRLVVVITLAVAAMAAVVPRPAADRGASAAVAARRTSHTIYVTMKCETRSGWVSDSALHARQGDTISFALTPESDVRTLVVTPKPRAVIFPGPWPYRTRKLEGAPGRPAVGNDMKPNAQGRYSYNVMGTCPGGPPARIDPDIIIDI
ncbi:MAG TPA: hypothetical protein PK788_09265 [Gemmatimonadaceae bacterium]|nr:hypothetical protein [Gemmatimonadaceae bacterium]HRQ77766.1 hypothetical protein [Gemmatimonadaceae bacterium]